MNCGHCGKDIGNGACDDCVPLFIEVQRICGACGRPIPEGGSIHCGLDHAALVTCHVCGGSGFAGRGSGYDAVCPECGGHKQLPADQLHRATAHRHLRFSGESEVNAETARRHELNYVLEEIGKLKQANSFDGMFGIADDLSAWLRLRINTNVANEPSPSALEPQETPK